MVHQQIILFNFHYNHMTAGQKKCLQFTKKYQSDLIPALSESNIFVATAVAQKSIESGYGTSSLAVNYNNFGGIKGKPIYATGKTSKGWAIFPSPKACFMSYASFLNTIENGQRYAKALKQTNPLDQIWWLVYSGYCTSPFNDQTKNADNYIKHCKSYVEILNQRGIGGKITAVNLAAYNQAIKNLQI